MEDYLYCPKCHGQFQEYEECPYCHKHLLSKRDMDRTTGHRLLQVVSVPVAALMAGSNIAFFREAASETHNQVWPTVGAVLVAVMAILVALPLRFYGSHKAVRALGYTGCGLLVAGGLALAGLFSLAWVLMEGLGANPPVSSVPGIAVAVLSALGAAIVLFLKSLVGEEEAR